MVETSTKKSNFSSITYAEAARLRSVSVLLRE